MDLEKPFIWRKKYEEQGIKIDEKEIVKECERRAEANRIELEKIRERQRKRDLEQQQRFNDNERSQVADDHEGNQKYWKDMIEITRNELIKKQAAEELEEARLAAESGDINSAIEADVMSLFEGKSTEELDEMEREMKLVLEDNDPTIDVSFYRSSLYRLKTFRAKLVVQEEKKEYIVENKETAEEAKEDTDEDDAEDEITNTDKFEGTRKQCIAEYKNGDYSPKKLSQDQLDPLVVCVDFSKEFEQLELQRRQIGDFMTAASKGMDDKEESSFSCEAPLRQQTYIWADKYLPRKPRYFNRVHTGFEWNKYNQTHYDIDNPPPKVVQGYKFNIFYPDLIDKSKTPRFTITPCKDDRDFCTIRFSAGPPYEDIAFRIVNREWNNSHKSGYRCQFINNMLQLWFQFKRFRYRR